MDKEYIILNEIGKNSNITQRELSKLIQCSVGSINILLNKMSVEGLIKIKRMPMNRILYMLTLKGFTEKLKKTSYYIKRNYNYIMETQLRIKAVFEDMVNRYGEIFVILENDEISELVKHSIEEDENIKLIGNEDICDKSKTVIVLNVDTYNRLKEEFASIINLIEFI